MVGDAVVVRGGSLGGVKARDGFAAVAERAGQVTEGEGRVDDDREGVNGGGTLEGDAAEGEGGLEVAAVAEGVGLEGEGEGLQRGGRSEGRGEVAAGDGVGMAAMVEVVAGELEEGLGVLVGRALRVAGGGVQVGDEAGGGSEKRYARTCSEGQVAAASNVCGLSASSRKSSRRRGSCGVVRRAVVRAAKVVGSAISTGVRAQTRR